MHICLSALAESSSGRCGTFVCYCWMMLRVDGCLNEDPGPLPGPRCLSALAESSSGRCGTFLCYCWMMLRVDGCLNEDPGPLPGPRCMYVT